MKNSFWLKGGDFTLINDEVEIDVFSRALADYGVFMMETEMNSQARKVKKELMPEQVPVQR